MPSALVLASTALAPLDELLARANGYAAEVRASSTRRAYLSDFQAFEAWCARRGLGAMPATPTVVAVYLSELAHAGKKPSTIERALAGIAAAHRTRGFECRRADTPIARVLRGIRRVHGVVPTRKAPVLDDELLALVEALDGSLLGLRDRALLTLGWFGAFRRSELVVLTVEDITRRGDGLVVTLRRSKGDQEQRGAEKGIPFAANASLCAVRAVDAWLATSAITTGPIFRHVDRHGHVGANALSDRAVALVVQRTAARAGLDPKTFAGHSLRAGFATTAARHGKSLDSIMRQTLHKSERVARAYLRHAGVFDDNAATGIA